MAECQRCGAELDFREAFCSNCGELTDRGKGGSELAGRYAAELADRLGKLIAAALAYVTEPENRKKVGIGAGAALLLFIAMTGNPISRSVSSIFVSTPDAPAFNDDGTPNFAEYEDVFIGDETEYLITGPANIRDFPTSQGTSVVGSLAEGETVMAREVQAFDPDSQWFKLTTGGYVWSSNLIGIGQETADPEQADVEFPDFLQGRWSWSDSCQKAAPGDEVLISSNSIQFENSAGKLLKIVEQGRSRIYHFAMSNESQTWSAKFAITIASDRSMMFLDGVEESSQTNYVLHNPKAICDSN